MLDEIWHDVIGYEGLYKVSNLGNVKMLQRLLPDKRILKEKILKQQIQRNGYLLVGLRKEGKQKFILVHRIVASAFIPNIENKKQVNHIDGNKLNNKVNNLEWVTASENIKHAYKTGLKHTLIGELNGNSKIKKEDVDFIRKNYKPYDRIFSRKKLAEMFNISIATVKKILSNDLWKEVLKYD